MPLRDAELRITPLLVGLCGSDVRVLRNEKAHTPGVLGHELAGRVVEVGARVEGFAPGDLVTINPVNGRNPDDIIGYNGSGFLCTHFTVSEALLREGRVFRFPPHVPAELAVFAEPLACCVHAQSRIAAALRGARVLVVGSGSFGLLHYLLARENGAAQVWVTARGSTRLEAAVAQGVLDAADARHVSSLEENTCDVVIVTANGADAVRESARYATPGGTLLLFGGLGSADRCDDLNLGAVRREEQEISTTMDGKTIKLAGSYGTLADDFAKSVALLASGRIAADRMLTHVVALAEAPQALAQYESGRIAGRTLLKLAVRP